MEKKRKIIRLKNQGQSTVEYLLVVVVASFFVLSLAVYMNPKLSSMLSNMEDVVAAKIRGGELVAHYKGGAGGAAGGQRVGGVEKGKEGESQEGGEETSGGGGLVGGVPSARPQVTDLEEDAGKVSKVATIGEGGTLGSGGDEGSSSSSSIGSRARRGAQVSGSLEQKPEGKKEKATAEEDKSSKGRGILYQEGQEEEAIGSNRFNWMRLIIMLLIFIVVVFMAFEIYKSIKLSRK